MGNFEEFFKTVKLDRENSEWSKRKTLESRYQELLAEIKEIGQAIKNKDMENLKEELGDALWDLMALTVIAEEKGEFTIKEIMQETLNKFNKRKPWLKEGKKITAEEEDKIWNKVKEQEKKQKK
ncbi:nucleotide pyrophosphohydrolase [Candidatus Woesearchaeota archaeon ex4484_78]|nr:MAG: nucleotide pyrophosphohydrolase [Candidatus Woesearchaeota archaeon ex4484_78]